MHGRRGRAGAAMFASMPAAVWQHKRVPRDQRSGSPMSQPPASALLYDELNPSPRLLMGPGPINVDPRVLRAMSMPLLGQFDPEFTAYMNETMVLYRQLFQTGNRTFLVDGTARAGIVALLVSVLEPGDRVLVPIFGRFGHLLAEIAARCGAAVETIETAWGSVFEPDVVADAVRRTRPKLVAIVHGDTSTTMAQPLAEIGEICRRHDCLLYVDATATLGGMEFAVDAWQIDAASAGLQKCLSGPPGAAPITFSERVERIVLRRKHVEAGIRAAGTVAADGLRIASNYFDLAMLIDYWAKPGSTTTPKRPRCSMPRASAPASCCAKVWRRLSHATRRPVAPWSPASRPWGWPCSATSGTKWRASLALRSPTASMATTCAPRCSTTSAAGSAGRLGPCTAAAGGSAPWGTTAANRTFCCASARSRRCCAAPGFRRRPGRLSRPPMTPTRPRSSRGTGAA